MKISYLIFFLVLFPLNAFSSAKVCIKGNTIEVKADLRFYGQQSNLGEKCAQEIYNMFNAPNAQIKIGNKNFKVKFAITHKEISEEDAFGLSTLNTKVETNYIRIEDKAANEPNGRSNNEIGQNCGFYAAADGLGTTTTCAHEFAHGLGLLHYNDRMENRNKPMKGADLRGQGQPGIMAARGFIVDPQYQWNPKAKLGEAGSTVNPNLRKVNLQDILDLHLDRLNFDSSGCAKLGKTSNITYDKNGSADWKGWGYVFGSMDELLFGNLGAPPVVCK